MQNTSCTPPRRAESPRPDTQRQRSNSFPIVEALGCSTPEARLILAEGRAAVHKRRAPSRRNQSVNDEAITTFDPRDHVTYLDTLAALPTPQERPYTAQGKSRHSRFPSDATDQSTLTIVPHLDHATSPTTPPSVSPLGDYSANLAQFIKAQLKSIPTYNAGNQPTSPLSPRSCPDLSFPTPSPPQSPNSPKQAGKRPVEAPKMINIPPVRAPMRSAFSAWSSTDDGTDDEALPLPDFEFGSRGAMSKGSDYTPSVLAFYETTNSSSFLFSSTPTMEEESDPGTARGTTFPDRSTPPGSSSLEPQNNSDYPSSSLSHTQSTSSSAPSYTSSVSTSSYFECKRGIAMSPHLKDRVIAAVTPSDAQSKMLSAMSPWEGGTLANVHNVFIESQQRVHVDGMSFDMIRDFVVPGGVPTPG